MYLCHDSLLNSGKWTRIHIQILLQLISYLQKIYWLRLYYDSIPNSGEDKLTQTQFTFPLFLDQQY